MFYIPFTSAQIPWDYCKVSAYATNVEYEEVRNIVRYTFLVAEPPSGSNITNTIYVMNYETGENYTKNVPIGSIVRIRYDDIIPDICSVTLAEDSRYSIVYYEGAVVRVMINSVDVPEFSTILVIPLFMTATLLAILYKRKRDHK